MTVDQLPVPVLVFVIAVPCFLLAWYRWRHEGKRYWLTIAWWMAVAWVLWTVLYATISFLRR